MIKIFSNKDYEELWPLLLLADPAREVVKEYIDKGEIYVTEIENEIVGLYVLVKASEGKLEIRNIAVKPKYQKLGVGRQLLKHAKSLAADRNVSLQICTANTSKYQINLYESEGFKITETLSDYFINEYPELIYENGKQCKDLIVMSFNN